MTAGSVAAVDLGATSGRVIVGHVGHDTLDTITVARFANTPVATPDGLHWDVLGLYRETLEGLRDAFREHPDLASIGIDSWAVDYALLREGRMLGDPFHYRDARTAAGVAAVHAVLPHDDLFARNGLQFLPFTTLYQLAAEPTALLDLADQMLLIPDLLGFWMTGIARAEATNASTTGLFAGGRWDDGLLDLLGVPRRLMPDTTDPGETLGPLLRSVASALGGSAPVVAVGSHDTASAVVAVPMDPARAVYISCGTWGLVGVEVPRPVLTDDARRAGFTNEGGVDGRIRLLRNVMGLWILSESVRTWERDGASVDLPALLGAAASVTTPVAVFDPDDPRFLPPGDMPARIDAWCEEHGMPRPENRAEYARSIVESLAQAFAAAVHEAARLGGVDLRTVHMVGGGALNALLCQCTADRSGLPIAAGPVEATALGNILVQARAAGFVAGSLESLRDLVGRTHPPVLYLPRAEEHR